MKFVLSCAVIRVKGEGKRNLCCTQEGTKNPLFCYHSVQRRGKLKSVLYEQRTRQHSLDHQDCEDFDSWPKIGLRRQAHAQLILFENSVHGLGEVSFAKAIGKLYVEDGQCRLPSFLQMLCSKETRVTAFLQRKLQLDLNSADIHRQEDQDYRF